MPNFFTPSSRTPSTPSESSNTRAQNARRSRGRKRFAVTGAVIAVGAMVGSGFAVQSSVEASNQRIADTAALTSSTGRHAEQLGVYSGILEAHAAEKAKGTISGAKIVLAKAEGKTDTEALSTSVASLGNYTLLAPERVFTLADETTAEAASVKAAAAKADRIAAKKKAAAKAAAEKKAAEAIAQEQAAAQETTGNSSASSRPSAPTNPSGAQAIARDLVAQRGWGDDQFGCLVPLWQRESGWNANAYNASSGATGIPQALPGSKMASAGSDWQSNPATQISWGLGYIADRYGTPCAAWDHSESAGWY